ncbi:hypothetical protein IM793_23405 [Pedobacter sp. MR2016-19]|uniref:hypothetical protein n=1 Tax=Pedobacter sp. MR2016-19 TaxID=2780089 RepID=UPI00187589FB|nr:hypothetical protein [Pedobacter sp. MR2016-19]MBE5322121.1 hypothetical protein [Pedobacter sp. MR2016-19]
MSTFTVPEKSSTTHKQRCRGFEEQKQLSNVDELVEMESPTFLATQTTDIVLFITQTTAGHFNGGMYSGNLHP